jgi:hypothetical protein
VIPSIGAKTKDPGGKFNDIDSLWHNNFKNKMNFTSTLAFSFLFTLAAGVYAFTPIANTLLTGVGLHKLMTSVCAGSLIISFIIQYSAGLVPQESVTVIYAVSFIFFVINYFFHRDQKSLVMWGIFLLQNVLHLFLLRKFVVASYHDYFYVISSGALLSIVTYGMVLGHWYLVVPKLSERPLLIALKFMWAILLLKITWTSFIFYKNISFFTSDTMLGAGYTFNWLMFLMRVLWGYVVISLMSYFTWRLVKMRDIQGATGILYAMTFFVIVGELCALYMFYLHGLKL